MINSWGPIQSYFVANKGRESLWGYGVNVEANTWNSVSYSSVLGKFAAVSLDGTNRVTTSSDGINWNPVSVPSASWYDIACNGNIFVAVGVTSLSQRAGSVMYSSDGVGWTSANVPVGATNFYTVVEWGDNKFVALGTDRDNLIWSSDGISWTGGSGIQGSWTDIEYANSIFVAVSDANNVINCFASSTDGLTWTSRACATGASGNVMGNARVKWDGEKFIATRGSIVAPSQFSVGGTAWSTFSYPYWTPTFNAIAATVDSSNRRRLLITADAPGASGSLMQIGTTGATSQIRIPDGEWRDATTNGTYFVTVGNGKIAYLPVNGTYSPYYTPINRDSRITAYYPMTSDIADYSGNARNFHTRQNYGTASTPAKWGYGVGMTSNTWMQGTGPGFQTGTGASSSITGWFWLGTGGSAQKYCFSAMGLTVGIDTWIGMSGATSMIIGSQSVSISETLFDISSIVPGGVTAGNLYHFALVNIGTQLTGYINGVAAGTVSPPPYNNIGLGRYTIGGRGGTQSWPGVASDIAFWNMGLTAGFINSLYLATKPYI